MEGATHVRERDRHGAHGESGPAGDLIAGRAPAHRRGRARLLIPGLALLIVLAVAAPAHASFLVYVCGPNLCRINPDGSGQAQLTTDGQQGTASIYGSPSLSRDGAKLAFTFDYQVIVANADTSGRGAPFASTAFAVRMRPDGGGVAEIEEALGAFQVCTYNVDGSGRNCPYGTPSAGWDPSGNLLISLSAGAPNYNREIADCPVGGIEGPCTDVRADDPANDLYDPAVSPDGSTLAVTVANGIGTSTKGHIALYNFATGQFERNLTTGTEDQFPAWSPDGTAIAFTRGESVDVIGVNDPPGTERQLVAQGSEATWGGPPETAPSGGGGPAGSGGGVAHALKRATVKGGIALVTMTCPGASPCGGVIELLARVGRQRPLPRRASRPRATKALIGKSRYRIAAGSRATIHVRLNGRGRSLVAHSGKHGLQVWLAGRGVKRQTLRLKVVRRHRGA